LLQHRLSLDFL
jgi:hypothetical protein